jgi:integrase
VRRVTTKGKITVKSNFVARRSPEESLFLDDLIRFIVHAKTKGTEELFSYRKTNGNRVVRIGRSVREEVKNTCELHGLDSRYFSAHSLRKGAITHMRAQGTSVDDRLDRGNYVPNEFDVRPVGGVGPARFEQPTRGLQAGR